jgi:hypothetical protein
MRSQSHLGDVLAVKVAKVELIGDIKQDSVDCQPAVYCRPPIAR